MMTRSTLGAERKKGAGGRPQATVICTPGSWRAISRITPEEMTQSPMRFELTKRALGAGKRNASRPVNNRGLC
ncbi:hypothetical protein D3C77_781120 [compost metagenome]